MEAALEILLLGPPRILRAGRPVTVDTRKATALLAHLALTGRPRSRESLCDLLWPGQDRDHARGALRRTLSVLRRGVGEEWLEATGDLVALRAAPGLIVDVREFRRLAGDAARAQEAVALYRGDLLEGFSVRDSPEFDAWLALEADLLRRELSAALGTEVRRRLEEGATGQAVAVARRWLALDPLHEPAHRELMRAYALGGDRLAALEQYRTCVRTLSQELGVAPLEETVRLFERVSDGTLAPAHAPPPARAPRAPAARPPRLPLTGRAAPLAGLLAVRDAIGEDGRLAVVEGEAGVGRSRLAAEVAAHAAADGATVLAARCHDDEARLPYGPVVHLLGEALRHGGPLAGRAPAHALADAALLLPALAPEGAGPAATAGPAAQARLFEAVAAVLAAAAAGDAPGVIALDDVHAADAATLDVVAYLARRLRGRPLLLLLTWRSEAVPPGHRLRRLAGELAREGSAAMIRLGRLADAEVAELVRATHPGDDALVDRVVAESEGLPAFVAEHLAADGDATPGLQSFLEARVGGIGPIARQLLETAATLGRSFGFDAVRGASGRSDEEAAAGLDELVARGLLHETDGPAYAFVHGRLRAHVYDDMGLGRRRLLHRRAADALRLATPGPEGAARVAGHLALAGEAAAAAAEHRRAAEHAASVLAFADAVGHLEVALALDPAGAERLQERIGDLRTLAGDYAGARASYEAAAAAAHGPSLAAVEHKLGDVHHRRGEWDRAEARFTVALEVLAGGGPPGLRARVLADLSLTLHHAGHRGRAAAVAGEARDLAEAAGDDGAQAQAHNLLGILARETGDLAAARDALSRSLALAERLADPAARVAALNNLALVERDAGDLDRALALTGEALRACTAHGDRHREAALENSLADLHHAAGRPDAAMAHLKRAVTAFAEVGADDAARLPEIWKLVSW